MKHFRLSSTRSLFTLAAASLLSGTLLSACAANPATAPAPASLADPAKSAAPATVAVQSSSAMSPRGSSRTLTGEAARGDWLTDAPGVRRLILPKDLVAPYQTPSANNGAHTISRPDGAWPKAPAGFVVTEFATGLNGPRKMVTAPNGDIFVAESYSNRVRILRDSKNSGKADVSEVFADGLKQPFGIAFYPNGANPQWIYVANTDSVVRFPYRNGDTKARGESETIVNNVSGGGKLTGGGHWTRDIVFSKDGKKLYLSIGSLSNVDDNERENVRARIFEYSLDAQGRRTSERTFASGIRNPVGIAIHPQSGQLWTSVNERDGLGDHLVPDYITSVQDNGFYGWPWFYIGANQDPRHAGAHPELASKVIVPDVLLQAHSASLAMTWYDGKQFPKDYRLNAFAAEHGSWNRSHRTGYKVVRVTMKGTRATGEYEDFLTGFVTADGDVWGRPVGVTVAKDGALLVSEDANGVVWRVAYTGKK